MKLRTEIDIKSLEEKIPLESKIDYSDSLFMVGSCFAQNIGERFIRTKFRATVNPTGVLFNPMSICKTLNRLYQRELVTAEELHEDDWGWYHYDFHSSLSDTARNTTLKKINDAIEEGSKALQEASCVVITLGTAWIYTKGDGEVVANCHKQPQREFHRRRASVEEITQQLKGVIEGCLDGKRIILTISPIRHIADGLNENSLSKATLRLVVEQLTKSYEQIYYFPSFEIMMDDLRDYRFYKSDMVHPSELAVDYIWDTLLQVALSAKSKELMQRVLRVVRAAEHRALNPSSEAHKRHCQAQLRAIAELPQIDWTKESDYFCRQLEINL